jgi:hypothetical protein
MGADSRPLLGGDSGRAYAVFTYREEDEAGSVFLAVVYLECRVLVPGQSGMFVAWTVPRAAYNGQAPLVEALLADVLVFAAADGATPPSGGSLIAAIPRLDPATVNATGPGIDGVGYTSPTYGYHLTWDNPWVAVAASSEGWTDVLQLTDGRSEIYLTGSAEGDESEEGCVQAVNDELVSIDGVTDVSVGHGTDGKPLQGRDAVGAYAVFGYTFGDEEGSRYQQTLYVACRHLGPGGSMLRVEHYAAANYYERDRMRQDLLAQLTFPNPPVAATPAASPT